MTPGHREAQAMFDALGRKLGMKAKHSFSRSYPTDGVWYSDSQPGFPEAPVAAIEVIVSESRKTVRGSLLTLEVVSPAVGILLVHEDEIRRRLVRAGCDPEVAARRVSAINAHAADLAQASRQRVEVWSFAGLVRRYRRATGAHSIYQPAA